MYSDHLLGLIGALASETSQHIARVLHLCLGCAGHQGQGKHIKIPWCIVDLIQEMHPDPYVQYMGYKPANYGV